jgi:hypothetical protein
VEQPQGDPLHDQSPVRRAPDEAVLADDPELQADLIAAAYATGREAEIDTMLNAVVYARRAKKNGILEWSRDGKD